jgi:hypothetical protein
MSVYTGMQLKKVNLIIQMSDVPTFPADTDVGTVLRPRLMLPVGEVV